MGTQADSLILCVAFTSVIISQSNPTWMQALGGAGVAASSGSRRDMGHVTHRRLPAQPQASFQQPHTLLGRLRNRRDPQGPISKKFRHRPHECHATATAEGIPLSGQGWICGPFSPTWLRQEAALQSVFDLLTSGEHITSLIRHHFVVSYLIISLCARSLGLVPVELKK